jgi:hypothetical protein
MGMSWPQGTEGPFTLSVSRAGLPADGQLGLLLPPGVKPDGPGIQPSPVQLDEAQYAEAKRLGLVTDVAWMIAPSAGEVDLAGLLSWPGQQASVGLYWKLGDVPAGSTWRIAAMARAGATVLGGSIYYLRVEP